MSRVPDEVLDLLRLRTEARSSRDFARADALRDEIEALGFFVRDTPEGAEVDEKLSFELIDPRAIENGLAREPSIAASFHVRYEGFLDDLTRFLVGFGSYGGTDAEVVVVDPGSSDTSDVERIVRDFPVARVLHLDRTLGWASDVNAGLKTSRGAVVCLVDLSIEPTGDIVTPLVDLFADATVGVAGPFGLVSTDLRDFQTHQGPDVHAIEGYLLAADRRSFARELLNERFSWYRNADIDLSFQIRAFSGARAVVVDLPVVRHAHRGWDAVSEPERSKRSRKNHALLLQRWRSRLDLLTPPT